MLRLGLIINPVAGVGGPAAMKGSDGAIAQAAASALGIQPKAVLRARETFLQLAVLLETAESSGVSVLSPRGAMGAESFALETGLVMDWLPDTATFDAPARQDTTAADTKRCVTQLMPHVDLLVFVGGDGTARDVLDAVLESSDLASTPVLGVPAGVKMHSGVFATSPRTAALLLHELISGGLVNASHAEVKDIDEAALRRGEVGSRTYGELLVPTQGGYLQHVKSSGKEVEALVLLEIAADITDFAVANDQVLVVGPGSTCLAIKEAVLDTGESDPTLLGFDVIKNATLLVKDATLADLQRVLGDYPDLQVLLSFSRTQGFLLGRGNQQLGPAVLDKLEPAQLRVVSSRTKLASLVGRPLLVDTGVIELDQKFSGLTQIISGYQDKLLYLVQPA